MKPARLRLLPPLLAAALAAACAQKPRPVQLLEYEILNFKDVSTPQAKGFEVDVLVSPWEDTSDVKRTLWRMFTDLGQGELKVRPGFDASSYKRADAAPGAVDVIKAHVYDAKPAEAHNKLCLAQWSNNVPGIEVPQDQRDTEIPYLTGKIYVDWNPDKLAARLQQ